MRFFSAIETGKNSELSTHTIVAKIQKCPRTIVAKIKKKMSTRTIVAEIPIFSRAIVAEIPKCQQCPHTIVAEIFRTAPPPPLHTRTSFGSTVH